MNVDRAFINHGSTLLAAALYWATLIRFDWGLGLRTLPRPEFRQPTAETPDNTHKECFCSRMIPKEHGSAETHSVMDSFAATGLTLPAKNNEAHTTIY